MVILSAASQCQLCAVTGRATGAVEQPLPPARSSHFSTMQSAEPAHCLRLFGSTNWKHSPPRQVEVEYVEGTHRYELDDFDAFLPPAPKTKGTSTGFHVPPQIPTGQRNGPLHSLAQSLKTKGLTSSAMLAALRAENLEKCLPPVDDKEVQRIVHSAMSQSDHPGYEPKHYYQEGPSAERSSNNSESEKVSPTTERNKTNTRAPIIVLDTALLGLLVGGDRLHEAPNNCRKTEYARIQHLKHISIASAINRNSEHIGSVPR